MVSGNPAVGASTLCPRSLRYARPQVQCGKVYCPAAESFGAGLDSILFKFFERDTSENSRELIVVEKVGVPPHFCMENRVKYSLDKQVFFPPSPFSSHTKCMRNPHKPPASSGLYPHTGVCRESSKRTVRNERSPRDLKLGPDPKKPTLS